MSPEPPPPAGWRRRGVLGLLQALLVLPWIAPAAAARPMPRPVPGGVPPSPGREHTFEQGVFEAGIFD